ncbi:hypothetical protein PIROE2DRAFT_2218 [Piromyces sp. E2]|nr:hypothetical protein PIROE2DRAFT_2218 [Piromyces sp. E2]|eukprot:OUM69794.1 hypothetical protein PIROE2DRAFT_2218 [Piromyces sp. E2]
MKFTTPVYALIATSALLAYPQVGQNGMGGAPKECDVKFFDEISDCVYVDNIEKYPPGSMSAYKNLTFKAIKYPEKSCSLFKTEKCQHFFTNFIPNFNKCGYLDETWITDYEKGIKLLEYSCVNDENNKLCSIFTEAALDNETKALKDTCKSKICTEAIIKTYELYYGPEKFSTFKGKVFDETYEYDESKDDSGDIAMAFILSDYCTAQHSAATNTNNANASNTTNTTNTTNIANNGNAQNSTVTGQQNAQSSGATTMKYSVFGTLLAMAYALL